MSDTKERLGIELYVDMDKVQKGFTDLQKLLSSTFNVESITKLVAEFAKIEAGTKKAEEATKRSSKQMNDFGEAAKLTAEEVKNLDKAMNDDSAHTKRAKGLTKLKDETNGVTLATRALAAEEENANAAIATKEALISSTINK